MIGFLRGKIKLKEEIYLILDFQGIGFKVFCSKKSLSQLDLEKEAELFIFLNRTQNVLDLYGFLNKEEKDFFEILVDVPGVGPKAALIIVSIGSLEKLREAIKTGDEKFFDKVPGIGEKKIKKIILELSGKLSQEVKKESQKDNEALGALVNLGISKQKAREALSQIPKEIEGPENIIREALKRLGK